MKELLAQKPIFFVVVFLYFTAYCIERYIKENRLEILLRYNDFLESEISKYKGRK